MQKKPAISGLTMDRYILLSLSEGATLKSSISTRSNAFSAALDKELVTERLMQTAAQERVVCLSHPAPYNADAGHRNNSESESEKPKNRKADRLKS
ncbi:hypothetical protein [Escherichia coli]|uniref:hypothetical protein n=1 Tax=Escherichia coli TaxID=562 RepID=UPI000BE149A9|nr:hypothetical protein [Escherichia coli]